MAKRIFITGGIGSGKSTLLEFLREKGAATVEADKVGHQVLTFADTKAELAQNFGSDIFDESGEVMRPALAAKAFASPEATALLDSITLKRLYAECLRQLDVLAKTHEMVVLEMAILDGRDNFYENADEVVAVVASSDVRIERLIGRGLTEEDARARLANQVSDDARKAISNAVLVNDGTLEEFKASIDEWWHGFVGEAPAEDTEISTSSATGANNSDSMPEEVGS